MNVNLKTLSNILFRLEMGNKRSKSTIYTNCILVNKADGDNGKKNCLITSQKIWSRKERIHPEVIV